MNRLTIAISILLLFALTSSATTPTTSNASLHGTYVFLMSRTELNNWGMQLICGGQPVFMGGSQMRSSAILGTLTFDGAGNVSGSFTRYGKFDQTSSDASVSCTSGGNGVYFGPTSGTVTGTYSVQSNGTGSATLTPSSGNSTTFNFLLVGNCASTGVNDAFLINSIKPDNTVENVGSARLQ